MKRYILIILLLTCTFSNIIISKTKETTNYHLNLDITNGLAHNGVSALLKDSRGYLWIGTYDGLNRYDNFSLTTYKNSADVKIFQTNRIRSLAEDKRDRIWVGTEFGVTIFNFEEHTFNKIIVDSIHKPAIVLNISINKQGSIATCICKEQSIFQYNMDGELLRYHKLPKNCTVNKVIELQNNCFILATTIGLFSYNAQQDMLNRLSRDIKSDVIDISKISGNDYIIAYTSGGVQRLKITQDNESGEVNNLTLVGGITYKNLVASSLSIDNLGSLWVGKALDGLYTSKDFATNNNISLTSKITSSRVSTILFDYDRVWIATLDKGVIVIPSQKSKFNSILDDEIDMPFITEYNKDIILVVYDIGIKAYKKGTLEEVDVPFQQPKEIVNREKFIIQDNNGCSWVVMNGLNYDFELYKEENNRMVFKESELLKNLNRKEHFGTKVAEALCDSFGNFWVAYEDNLICLKFDSLGKVNSIESIWDHKIMSNRTDFSRTRALYYDKVKNILWVGTNRQGLFRIKLNDNGSGSLEDADIKEYLHIDGDNSSLSSNFVSSILRAKDGTLWIGTEQGGLCYAIEDGDNITFKQIYESDGLSNNVVKSLAEDKNGNIWISTNIGLNLYNTQSKKIVVYRKDNGLQNEDFWYSSLSFDDGSIAMATPRGLTTFNPELLYNINTSAKLYLDKFSIFGKEIKPKEKYNGEVKLFSRLKKGDCIKLKHNENVFSVSVNILNNNLYSNFTVSYKLGSTNNDWITLPSNSRTISFSGVEPGDYELIVKLSTADGLQVDSQTLNIEIAPPFYASIYAYILYIIFLLFLIFIAIHLLLKFQKLNYSLEIETLEKSHNDDKLRYLSNISHELKTPLSLIMASLAILREKFSAESDSVLKLDLIKRQSKKMLELIDIVHGIEANDLKSLKFTPTIFSFDKMIDDLSSDFCFMSEYDNKLFSIERGSNECVVDGDRAMIEKIITNLVSNALKHTIADDNIKLYYTRTDDNCILLKVSDTGCGISEADLPYIFDRFYQARRSGSNNIGGTGIGLSFSKRLVEMHNGTITVESEVGVGTTFTIQLPIIVNAEIPVEVQPATTLSDVIWGNEENIVISNNLSSSMVYIVEDNQDLRRLLCEIIGKHFLIKSFGSAPEMLTALEEHWPDIVVSDVMMPQISGYELCSKLKGDIMTSHIPIILLTAATTIDNKIEGLRVGADAYIPKPFYPKHLITRIETLLHNRLILSERYQTVVPLVRKSENTTSTNDIEFMRKLYDLINKNIANENINIEDIAKEMGQNRSMFFKKVKAITNNSPYEIIKEYRLVKAAELLEKGDYTVTEVSDLTGFKDRSHFSRLFKEKYNVAPSKYVKGNSAQASAIN